jgi:hypothetical protein
MPTQDGSSAPPLQDVHAGVELDADGMPLGTVSIEADMANTPPSDDASIITPGCTDQGDGILVLRLRGPGDNRDNFVGSPWLFIPINRLQASGGQCRLCVLIGHQHREAAARDAGFGMSEYSVSDLG